MGKLNTETAKVDVILNGQKANATLKEIEAAARQLNAELRKLPVNSEEFAKKSIEFNKVKTRLAEVKNEVNATGMSLGKMADGFNKYFAMTTAMVASLTGLIFSFRKVIDVHNQYEKKLDNLSALTGLTGEKLNWLSEQAKEMSIGMVEGDIRITQSADAIVDAYTKVGSARPELLKNKEDLNMVTKEAIILSEAANTELQPAVVALTGVLNQFNAPASDSRRIINALAAGSKEGAGEIPYLTEAIEKSGTVAADCGIAYEELVGIIETLAPRITQPEMAGRSLRAVIIKLQEGANDTNPAIVGFTQAIENLGKKNLSAAELTKIFGIENITAGKILINNIGEIKKYTEAVTGTNVALEQAAINTDNNTSKLAQAQNKVQLYSIELGKKLAPALTFSTNAFSYLMKAILGSISFFNEHRAGVLSALAAVAAYTIVVYGATVATKAWTLATKLFDMAWKALNTTMKGNVWGLIAAAIAGVASYLLLYKKTVDETAKSQQRLNDIKKSFNDKVADEKAGLDLLFNALKKTNAGSRERQELIDTINQRYGTTLKNIKDEKEFLDQLNLTYADLIINMQKKALVESKEDALKQAFKDRQEIFDKIKVFDENLKKQSGGVEINPVEDPKIAKAIKGMEKAWEGASAGADEYRGELEAIEKTIKDISTLSPQDLSIIGAGSGKNAPVKPPPVDENEVEKRKKYLEKVQKDLEEVVLQIIADEKEKELKLSDLAFKRKIDEIKGNSHDEIQLRNVLEAQRLQARQTIIEKFDKKEKELDDKKLEQEAKQAHDKVKQNEETNRQIFEDRQDALDAELMMLERTGQLTLEKEKEIAAEQRDAALAAAWDNADKQYLIWEQYYARIEDLNREHVQKLTDLASKGVDAMGKAWGAWITVQNTQDQASLKKYEANIEKKKEILEKSYNEGRISQEEYNKELKQLDQELANERARISKESTEREYQNAVVMILVKEAIAIASAIALAVTSSSSWVEAILGVIGSVAAVVAEIAVAKNRLEEARSYKQYSQGNYDVIGADDGKFYSNVPYTGRAKTGIYTKPSLVAEVGPEMIVDADTTKNIQMNYPEILQAIHFARVPQYASGNYSQTSTTNSPQVVQVPVVDPELKSAIQEFNQNVRKGIRAKIVWSELEDANDRMNSIRKNAGV